MKTWKARCAWSRSNQVHRLPATATRIMQRQPQLHRTMADIKRETLRLLLAGQTPLRLNASGLIADVRRSTHFGQSQRPKADGERTKLLGGQAIGSPHAARTVIET
jgi:hypothetical protein